MRIGRQLLHESKKDMKTNENRRGRDLLSLLVRANTASELPPSQRLSDEDVLARERLYAMSDLALKERNRGANILGRWTRDHEVLRRVHSLHLQLI
jgi:hypothetical protein